MSKVDSIIRGVLLEKSLPIHFYIRFLSWGLECLKELELDHIGKVKTVEMTVDSLGRVKLPCDFVDWIRIGQLQGQHVHKMGETRTFARQLRVVDGIYTPYADADSSNDVLWSSIYVQDWFDKNGDFRGRGFGGNGSATDTFMVLDGELQVNNDYSEGDIIVIDYLGYDECNASSEVPKYAESTIKSYIEYKYLSSLPKSNPYDKNVAKATYENEHRKLVARLNSFDIEEMRRIRHRNFKQTVKL